MKSLSRLLFAFVLIWGCLVPTAGMAGEWINPGEERFLFVGGAFLPAIDTSVRVDNANTGGNGTEINLQDDLGFDDTQTTFYGNFIWRFFPRHRIGVGYFRFKDDITATAQRPLEIGDEIYDVGASLSTEFKFEIIPIQYSYSFIKREKMEFAGTVGLHWYRINFAVGGSASLGNLDADAEVTAEANAPLPLLGLSFRYNFTPKWTASIQGGAFALSIGDFDGNLVNLSARTEYWFFNHFGAGLALDWFRLDVEVDSNDWRGELEYKYWGPEIYITVRF
jgi:hypothetical protein